MSTPYGPKDTVITYGQAYDLLSAESGTRPRIYGLDTESNTVVKLASHHYLNRYFCEIIWLSGTTLTDLVREA